MPGEAHCVPIHTIVSVYYSFLAVRPTGLDKRGTQQLLLGLQPVSSRIKDRQPKARKPPSAGKLFVYLFLGL